MRCVIQSLADQADTPDSSVSYLVLDTDLALEDWPIQGEASLRACTFDPHRGWRQVLQTGRMQGLVTFEKKSFELEEVLIESLTARGSRLIDAVQLKTLLDYASAKDVVLQCTETYELSERFEQPRIDLNAYVEDDACKPITDRLALASREFEALLQEAAVEPNELAFQVWAVGGALRLNP